jgi:replicative DNA helicase
MTENGGPTSPRVARLPRRERGAAAPIPPHDLGAEKSVISSLLLDPRAFHEVLAEVRADDFYHPAHQTLFGAMKAVHDSGRPVDLITLAEQLTLQKQLAAVGGPPALTEIADYAATAVNVAHHARIVRDKALKRSLLESLRGLTAVAGDDAARSDDLLAALERMLAAAPRSRSGPMDLTSLAITGDRLRSLRTRPAPQSPIPDLLDPEPSLVVLSARPKSGKTAFALAIARAWVLGAAPWPGAPELPGTRALVISREQTATRIDATLRRLSVLAQPIGIDGWTDRLAIVARDAELPAAARPLLLLDSSGRAQLRSLLAAQRDAGDPIGLVILDSLSRLMPAEIDEIDNSQMSRWLDELASIATEMRAYVIAIHHAGHSTDPSRSDPRSAPRGASAIAAVAQTVWLLDRVPGSPHHRRLAVDGAAVLPAEITLQVAPETAEPGEILYFRRAAAATDRDPRSLLEPGETLSTRDLARRLAGDALDVDAPPPGDLQRLAAQLRERWRAAGLVTVTDGPRRAQLIALKEKPQ